MAISLHRQRALLALGMVAVAMFLAYCVASGEARAATSPYCGGQTLASSTSCYGAERTVYGTSGYGNQHSVCVWVADGGGGYVYEFPMCSGGAGQSVYNPLGFTHKAFPAIMNNGGTANTVFGTAHQP